MISFRSVQHPKNSRFREMPIKLTIKKYNLITSVIKGKKKIKRNISFNDLTFIDEKAIFTFDDMSLFKSKPLVNILKRFMTNIRKYVLKVGENYFRESCVMILEGKNDTNQKNECDIYGKKYNDDYTVIAFCFPKGMMNINNTRNLLTKFNFFYLNFKKNSKDLLSSQTYQKNDPKNLMYYTSEWDESEIKTMDYIKSWTIANEDGVHLTQKYVNSK